MYPPPPSPHPPYPQRPPRTGPPAAPGSRPLWMVIGPCLGAMTGAHLLALALAPTWLDTAQRALDLSTGSAWALLIAYVVAAVIGAPAGVLLGRRLPTTVGVAGIVCMLLGAVSAIASDVTPLMIGRVVSGLGAGAVAGTAMALATRVRPRRGLAIGLVSGLCGLSLVVGFVLTGVLTASTSWRFPLLLAALPLGAALVATIATGIVTMIRSHPTPSAPHAPPGGPYTPGMPYAPSGGQAAPGTPYAPSGGQAAPGTPYAPPGVAAPGPGTRPPPADPGPGPDAGASGWQ